MWRIGRFWINPTNLMYVYEETQQVQGKEEVVLKIHFNFDDTLTLRGPERQAMLNCLAQQTTVFPHLVERDDDEMPF